MHGEPSAAGLYPADCGLSFAPLGCRKLAPEASCSSGLETVDLVLGKQSAANSVAGSSSFVSTDGAVAKEILLRAPMALRSPSLRSSTSPASAGLPPARFELGTRGTLRFVPLANGPHCSQPGVQTELATHAAVQGGPKTITKVLRKSVHAQRDGKRPQGCAVVQFGEREVGFLTLAAAGRVAALRNLRPARASPRMRL